MAEKSVNAPKRRMSPNSLANLRKPWQAGESGNAKGTPGPKITPRIERMIQMSPNQFFAQEYATVADIIAARYVFESMISGFDKSSQELIERVDGKVAQRAEIDVTKRIETVVIEDHIPPSLRRVK
jgi:hypothetical protein